MISAIPTHYKGYHFRSRLEARWALFFDQLEEFYPAHSSSLTWQYEKEGFKLASGDWYLPDFYLEPWNCYVEVKPTSASENERNRCVDLAYITGSPIIILQGTPGDRLPEIYCMEMSDSSYSDDWFKGYFTWDANSNPCFEVECDADTRCRNYEGWGNDAKWLHPSWERSAKLIDFVREPILNFSQHRPDSPTIIARSARF